jgi:uncharacterized protein YkwD
MLIFAIKVIPRAFCALGCLTVFTVQVLYGQKAIDNLWDPMVLPETTEIAPAQAQANGSDRHSEPPSVGTPSTIKRPLPTGSLLLPAPMVFARESVNPVSRPEGSLAPSEDTNGLDIPPHARPKNLPESDSQAELEVLRLTNEVRASAGLPPLAWNEDLANAARHHAADMETDGYFDHDTYDRINGQLVRICSAQERMNLFTPAGAGENIAHGQRTPDEVMQTWLASPPHRRGILRTDISTIGVGKVGKNWVQNFGW